MRKRLFFGEMCRLAVLTQGHVQVRVLAFKQVSRVTTGIRLVHSPGLFHIYAATGHSLDIAATVSRTVFQTREVVSDLHAAVAAGSWAHFVYLWHTVVHFGIQARFLLYIYTRSTHAVAGPLHPGAVHILGERTSIHMKQESMNKHHQPATSSASLQRSTRRAKTLLRCCVLELPRCSTPVKSRLRVIKVLSWGRS